MVINYTKKMNNCNVARNLSVSEAKVLTLKQQKHKLINRSTTEILQWPHRRTFPGTGTQNCGVCALEEKNWCADYV
jgi:hypothetical protein